MHTTLQHPYESGFHSWFVLACSITHYTLKKPLVLVFGPHAVLLEMYAIVVRGYSYIASLRVIVVKFAARLKSIPYSG